MDIEQNRIIELARNGKINAATFSLIFDTLQSLQFQLSTLQSKQHSLHTRGDAE